MWLFALFVAVPIIEIALFIQVGGVIGLWPTLLIVVLTALLGTALLRQQGAAALSRLQGSLSALSDPSEPLAEGAMILFAGALLLTPGFFTDALGFSLMVPGVRRAIFQQLKSRVRMVQMPDPMAQQARQPFRSDDVIDGDFEEVPPRRNPDEPSGWTRH